MTSELSAVAIIPARGGSKGLPRKNVLPLAGKPLIAWTIDAALAAKSIERVFVSTDDAEIAAVAERFGAGIIWRPEAISGDLVSSEDAILHALSVIHETGCESDLVVFLQCTSPLTMGIDIDGTVNALISNQADTAVAVADFHYFIWKDATDSGEFIGVNHEKNVRLMRQQREQQFIETGAVYVMKTLGFKKYRHRFFGKTARYVMPEQRVLEIDTPVDFQVAETLLSAKQVEDRRAVLPARVDAVIFDFDGVFTNDRVTLSEHGDESVVCSRSDGMGIKLARLAGIRMLILSSEVNTVVKRRAEKLQLDVIHGVEDKVTILDEWLIEHKLSWSNIIYVGNDVNDVGCLDRAACGVVVADARPEARAHANLVLTNPGGNNAVRELTDLLLSR